MSHYATEVCKCPKMPVGLVASVIAPTNIANSSPFDHFGIYLPSESLSIKDFTCGFSNVRIVKWIPFSWLTGFCSCEQEINANAETAAIAKDLTILFMGAMFKGCRCSLDPQQQCLQHGLHPHIHHSQPSHFPSLRKAPGESGARRSSDCFSS